MVGFPVIPVVVFAEHLLDYVCVIGIVLFCFGRVLLGRFTSLLHELLRLSSEEEKGPCASSSEEVGRVFL